MSGLETWEPLSYIFTVASLPFAIGMLPYAHCKACLAVEEAFASHIRSTTEHYAGSTT